ncbi:MAG TPA: hypothetical protein VM123_17660 [archaeon]|nr:hypothetical protein [archaeon]
MKFALVFTAAVFVFSTSASAQSCCSTSETSAGKTAAVCSDQESASTSAETKTLSLDTKAVQKVYAAAESGDFSPVEACATTREALKKLTLASSDFNPQSREIVLAAASGETSFSKVSACETTRGQIKKALLKYALNAQGVDAKCLSEIEEAAASGDFSKVDACPVSRELLKKVVAAKSDFKTDCKTNVLSAFENGDFSKVAACKATRDQIKQAVSEFREKSVQTAMKN